MARQWTAAQLAAMNTRGRTLLVSAAAGSGKTATLTERIIRRLTDREIIVVGNPRVYKALQGQMELICQELQRLAVDEEVPPDLLESPQMVTLTLTGLKEECE